MPQTIKSIIFWLLGILYVVSLIFVASGAVNFGFSRFLPAVPFMISAVSIAAKKYSRTVLIGTVLFAAASVLVNVMLEENPLVFPILDQGYVTINNNGYHRAFIDGSGGFSSSDQKVSCSGCGEVKYENLLKGQEFKVLGVNITHSEFSTEINLKTEAGEFSQRDYMEDNAIMINKPVVYPIIKTVSYLMNYPAAILLIPSIFK